MAAPVLPITELAQLAQVKDDFFPASFVTNAKCIFDHDHNDIKKILNDKDLVTLKNIRNALLTGVEQLFPSFPAKLALPRTISDKGIFIQDILLLGASIAKKIALRTSRPYICPEFNFVCNVQSGCTPNDIQNQVA